MVAREIVHTCANVHVARAALASIGGDLAARIRDRACSANLTGGALVAHLVKDFKRLADHEEWDGVDLAAQGADQPILSGLRYILDNRLERTVGFYAPYEGRGLTAASLDSARDLPWGQ